jgi:hypothetical protein
MVGDEDEIFDNVQNPSDIQHKLDIMSVNNCWNDKNERIVISVGENAAAYKWMHEKSAVRYKMISQALGIVQIVLTTALSAETIIPTSDSNTSIDILRRILIYVITVLSVLQNFLKYEELSERHISAANSFSHLYHEIQEQMCMYRRHRQNATKYVSLILKQYDSFVVNGPGIERGIINQLKMTFRDAGISMPDVADKIQRIEIITEPYPSNEPNINNVETKMCNLDTIHNAFQIHGDISDKDIENTSAIELKQLRHNFSNERALYEYNRYMQHTTEFD